MRLQDAPSAYNYLVRCKEYPVKTPDDKKVTLKHLPESIILCYHVNSSAWVVKGMAFWSSFEYKNR